MGRGKEHARQQGKRACQTEKARTGKRIGEDRNEKETLGGGGGRELKGDANCRKKKRSPKGIRRREGVNAEQEGQEGQEE